MFKQSKLQPNKTQQYLSDSEMGSSFLFSESARYSKQRSPENTRILEILRKFPSRYNFDLIYVENVRTLI